MGTYISNAIETDDSCKKLEWSVKTGALNLAETRVMFTVKGRCGQPIEVCQVLNLMFQDPPF